VIIDKIVGRNSKNIGQDLAIRGQGQGKDLQMVSSRILEDKPGLEDNKTEI